MEGYQASSEPCDITLVLTHLTTGFKDRINLTVAQADLDISGVADDDELTIGGLVVRRYDNNNAPRKEVVLQKVVPNTWDCNVVLSRNNSNVKLYDAAAGGTEITFNGTDNKFANSNLPKSLWVQGDIQSSSMRDVTLRLAVNDSCSSSPPEDNVKLTVLWVDSVTLKFSSTDSVSVDNDKREAYKNWTVANTYNLGVQLYNGIFGGRMGWGTEAKGDVRPSDFSYPGMDLKLDKDTEYHDWVGNGASTIDSRSFSASIPPGNDTDDAQTRDDNPDPSGHIYDFDAPGLAPVNAPKDTVHRTRNNFRAFASITIDGNPVRCSPVTSYFVRFSMRQVNDPSGSNWVVIDPPDVTNDKQAGSGTTNLTWDLQ